MTAPPFVKLDFLTRFEKRISSDQCRCMSQALHSKDQAWTSSSIDNAHLLVLALLVTMLCIRTGLQNRRRLYQIVHALRTARTTEITICSILCTASYRVMRLMSASSFRVLNNELQCIYAETSKDCTPDRLAG